MDSGGDGELLDRLEDVLDRRTPLRSLDALARSLDQASTVEIDVRSAAFAIDSSVLLRLATHRRSADILDYLPGHTAPVVVPGQTIQEFWNNQLTVIDTVSSSIEKRFAQLADEVEKIAPEFADVREKMSELLRSFETDYGHVWQGSTRDSLSRMLTILRSSARTDYVPRDRFGRMASARKASKTPPGFKDDGDGDFLVWSDLLFSLLKAVEEGQEFASVVLLTNDTKKDWSSGGRPHPLLCAELDALVQKPLACWTLEEFISQLGSIA